MTYARLPSSACLCSFGRKEVSILGEGKVHIKQLWKRKSRSDVSPRRSGISFLGESLGRLSVNNRRFQSPAHECIYGNPALLVVG